MTSRTASPDDLAAVEQIKQLKARYFRLLDTQAWDAWGDVFAEDAVMDVSDDTGDDQSGLVRGRARIVKAVSGMLSGARTVHHGHMPEIDVIDADHASGIWAMQDTVDFAAEGEPARGIHGSGWYHEEYQCVDGVWRITWMRLERLRVDALE
jgi:ketosteroid isomerase-like protein